jgi:hypothetical protein
MNKQIRKYQIQCRRLHASNTAKSTIFKFAISFILIGRKFKAIIIRHTKFNDDSAQIHLERWLNLFRIPLDQRYYRFQVCHISFILWNSSRIAKFHNTKFRTEDSLSKYTHDFRYCKPNFFCEQTFLQGLLKAHHCEYFKSWTLHTLYNPTLTKKILSLKLHTAKQFLTEELPAK